MQGIEDEKLNVPFQQLQNATLTMLIAFEGDQESFKFWFKNSQKYQIYNLNFEFEKDFVLHNFN